METTKAQIIITLNIICILFISISQVQSQKNDPETGFKALSQKFKDCYMKNPEAEQMYRHCMAKVKTGKSYSKKGNCKSIQVLYNCIKPITSKCFDPVDADEFRAKTRLAMFNTFKCKITQ